MQTRTGIVKVQHKQEIRQPSLGPFSLAIAFKVNNRNKLVFEAKNDKNILCFSWTSLMLSRDSH
jgi:hypothetical protein